MYCRDDKLSPIRKKSIEAHLQTCDACRLEYHRLRAAARVVQRPAAEDDVCPGGAAAVLVGIHNWEAARSRAAHSGEAVKRRVAGEIGRYLGKKAAGRILQPVSDEGQDLLPAIEPVLALFLGRRAASHLVSHIVAVAIVRV